ncbi:MAG: DUF1266 domain-containing protein [Treponema sp.]|nr:DUF1266 domain-containing protein [Treponema sp.]
MARIIIIFLCLSLFQAGCSKKEEITEPVLWINGTHAVLTEVNGGDVYRFGTVARGILNRTKIRNTLENSWEIKTKEDLDSMIASLIEGRHNQKFLEEAEDYGITAMSRAEFESELESVSEKEEVMYFRNMFDAYQAFGGKAILGWDLSRATQLCAFGYVAEFYSYDEAADKALAAGKVIQNCFNSWDDFYASYFYGYAYWSEDDLEDLK